MTALTNRLRSAHDVLTADNWHTEATVCAEAATLIERQQRVIEEARATLIWADLKIRGLPGQDQSDVEFIRATLKALDDE